MSALSSVDFACLPTDPLVFLANLSPPGAVAVAAAVSMIFCLLLFVTGVVSTTSGEDDFV
jgi:hypothetical protein